MNLNDKFARVAALRPSRRRETVSELPPDRPMIVPEDDDRLARILGGEVQRNRYGQYLSVKRWYDRPEMCAPTRRALSLLLPQGFSETKSFRTALDPEQWLFLDTETTGLSGGTGTYAFLVGLAWWDAGGLQVEQFCMRDLDEEHSLLLELSERMRERPVLVTFNGKTFDWPLLETRYRMTRNIAAFPFAAHLDLLHPARQLWRPRLGSVRLKDLELHALGGAENCLGWTREEDIDSSLIPNMYFDYLRGHPAEPLAGVFRHNQMDLRGLAALAVKMIGMLDPEAGAVDSHVRSSGSDITVKSSGRRASHSAADDPLDLYGLSRLLHRRGERTRARAVCETALRAGLPEEVERLAQRDLALLAKRERDYARANSLWEKLSNSKTPADRGEVSGDSSPIGSIKKAEAAIETAIEAAEQLAMYYEHRAKQPERAVELTQMAIVHLRTAQLEGSIHGARSKKIGDRLQRRLARLTRRVASLPAPGLEYSGNESIG